MIFNIVGCELIFLAIPIKHGLVSVEITPEGPAYADSSGADGTVTRWATNERRARANITLSGISKHNEQLSAIHAADVSAVNGLGVGPFLFIDGNGATRVSTDTAWIEGMPAKTFGAQPGDVVWPIRLALTSPLNYIIGGNG